MGFSVLLLTPSGVGGMLQSGETWILFETCTKQIYYTRSELRANAHTFCNVTKHM